MFSAEGRRITAYVKLAKLFPRHELPRLATEALQASPNVISTVAKRPLHCRQGPRLRLQAPAKDHCLYFPHPFEMGSSVVIFECPGIAECVNKKEVGGVGQIAEYHDPNAP